MTLEDIVEVSRFSWIDYLVFSVLLVISASIGIYYGIKDKKNTEQFLMAGKSMTPFPVAMSLIASYISAIGLMGIPSEVYSQGTMFLWNGMSLFLVFPVTGAFYLPVFWNLEITSAYEYLELRFHTSIRTLCSCLFMVQTILYMAIVVYTPALALTQVTGLSHHLSVSLICGVCVFYTTLGGIKAVLWTDVLQIFIITISLCVVYTKGTLDAGGISKVFEIGSTYDRVEFDIIDADPTTRHTVWNLFSGGFFQWTAIYGCSQTQIQRYMCLKNKKMVYQAMVITMLGMVGVVIVCGYGGLVAFAFYHECDPLGQERITKSDQILPLFVMDTFKEWHGIPGLFVAGLFSGSLSTLSSGINSLAAITLEDLIKRPCYPHMSEKMAIIISMLLSLAFGLLTFGLVFVVGNLGANVVTMASNVFGMIGGPVLACFSLGMLFPPANKWGASIGPLTGFALCVWIVVGTHLENLKTPPRPFLEGGCPNANITVIENVENTHDDVFYLYKLSYMLYSTIGFVVSFTLGVIISLITGGQDLKTLDKRTLSPGVLWLWNKLFHRGRYYAEENKRVELELSHRRQMPAGKVNLGYN